MTVNPTDKFLVNRSGSSYNVEQQNLMAQLQDDDLLLVNRNSKSYKITGAEFKDSLSSPPIIQSVTLTEDDPAGARFTSQDFTATAVMLDNGNPASTKSIRGWVEGKLMTTPTVGPIGTVGTSTAAYTPLIQGYTPDGAVAGFQDTNPAVNAFDGDPATNAMNESETAGAYVALDMKFINVNKLRVQFKGTSKNNAGIYRIEGDGIEAKRNIKVGDPGFKTFLELTLTSSTVENIHIFEDEGGRSSIAQIEVNGKVLVNGQQQTTLTLPGGSDLTYFQPGVAIKEVGNGDDGEGTIESIDGTTLKLFGIEDNWDVGSDVATNFQVAGDSSKKYPNLDASLNVIGLTDDDTYTRSPANTTTPKISFPATLDNGEAPDAALPLGTSIQTEILAENTAGSDEMASNVVTPSPSCTSGPIETDTITAVDVSVSPTYSAFGSGSVQKGSWENLFSSGTPAEGTANGVEVVPNSTLTWNYSEGVTGSIFKIFYVLQNVTGCTLTINDGTSFTPAKSGDDGNWKVLDITDKVTSGELTKISWKRGSVSTGGAWAIGAIYVDDSKLVDGESLTSLTFASGQDLAKLEAGDELRQNPHPSPKFSDGLADVAPNGNNNAFDGSTSTWASFSSQGLRSWDWNASEFDLIFDPAGGELVIWCGHRQTQTNWTEGNFEINGIDTGISTPRGISDSQIGGLGGVGNKDLTQWCIDNDITTITRIRETSLSSPAGSIASGTLGAIKLNGEFLIDGDGKLPTGIVGSVDTSAKTVTLATSTNTWGPANASYNAIGPNYVCPAIALNAGDPVDVATFNSIKDSLDDYAAERAQFRADLRQRLIAAGFSQEEMVQMMLVDDGDVAFSKDGYFPLYLTEEEANRASDNGSSHAHVMDGVTYYMPDTGVTIYHGTYGMAPEDTAAGTADISDVADNTDTTGTGDISDVADNTDTTGTADISDDDSGSDDSGDTTSDSTDSDDSGSTDSGSSSSGGSYGY